MDALTGTHTGAWRLLTETGYDPLRNLAIEEAVSRASDGRPTIRIWRNSPCVVLGRFQVLDAEVDQRACECLQVPVYRRFTGGGAVYNDLGNLNVSLVIPKNHLFVQRRSMLPRIPGQYALLLEPLANALASIGIEATFTDRSVLVRERKVSGVAAWFGVNTILVHATLLVDADLNQLELVLRGPGAPGNQRWERTKSNRVEVTSLAREGLAYDSVEGALPALIAALAVQFGNVLEPGALTLREEELAAELLSNRYSKPLWHAEGASQE